MIDIAAVSESVKEKKENFVTGGTGGSLLHIILATTLTPFLLLILSLLDQINIFKSLKRAFYLDQVTEDGVEKSIIPQRFSTFLKKDFPPYSFPFQFYQLYYRSTPFLCLFQRYIWEFLILILPQLYCMTIASKTFVLKNYFLFVFKKLPINVTLLSSLDSPLLFLVAIYFVLCCVAILLQYRLLTLKKAVYHAIQNQKSYCEKVNRKYEGKDIKYLVFYISHYKATIMLISVIAILAVDFHKIFPKDFVKTEQYGTSVMDLGVGCMVFASAITSLYAREGRWEKEKEKSMKEKHSFVNTLKKILPYVVLGSSRLILHRNLNYQEHVSEYGVHWNFLLTQASLILILYLIGQLNLRHNVLRLLSFGLLVFYQYLLKSFAPLFLVKEIHNYQCNKSGNTEDRNSDFVCSEIETLESEQMTMTDYIFHETRNPYSFFSMNREGILSLLGYTVIYLIGQDIGYSIIFPFVKEIKSIEKSRQLELTLDIADNSKIIPVDRKVPHFDQSIRTTKTPRSKGKEKQFQKRNKIVEEQKKGKNHRSEDLKCRKLMHNLSLNLLKISLCTYCIYYISDTKIQDISRRLTNMAYIAWCIAVNSFQLLLFTFFSESVSYNSNDQIIIRYLGILLQQQEKEKQEHNETITESTESRVQGEQEDEEEKEPEVLLFSPPYSTRSILLEAINRNLFPFFILCNIFTGIINLTLPTSEMDPFPAFCILTLYVFCTVFIVVYFDVKLNVTLKL